MNKFNAALVGNPNCGKSTLFNLLTGKHQAVGNWCGVTVEKKLGWFRVNHETTIDILDLPGCYHIASIPESPLDEQITTQYLASSEADLIINVVDATHLERHLFLTLQLLELGKPVIVVLNMMDIARKQKLEIDVKLLTKRLNCPVIEMVATKKQGIKALKTAIEKAQSNSKLGVVPWPLLSSDPIEAAKARYAIIQNILQNVVVRPKDIQSLTWKDNIDNWVLHRYFGLPIFFMIMYFVFLFTIKVGGFFQDYVEIGARTFFIEGPEKILTQLQASEWLISLLVSGVGQGLSTTVSFIPILAGMFLSLVFLESSGYMARAAFIMDKVMQWVGLPGKSFVPMIIGFGCNVPAVMACRTLDNYRDRVLTILMSPFMSCGARLAIYALFVAAFFPKDGQNIIFGLYLIGIFVALLSGFLLRTTVLSGERSSLIIELPPYRLPTLKFLWKSTYLRLKRFILKAGVLIVSFCVLIGGWGAVRVQLGVDDGLATIGRTMTPLFKPMGIEEDNWPATVGLLTGILAKEVVVGTLSALYSQETLSSNIEKTQNFNLLSPKKVGVMVTKFGSPKAAFAYLLFLLLYFPCVSVVAAIAKELNWRWAMFSVGWTTGIAYVVAVLFYQSATLLSHPLSSSAWILGLLGILVSCYCLLRNRVQHKIKIKKAFPTRILAQTY